MARPLRMAYPGAFYHVTARGNERRKIFQGWYKSVAVDLRRIEIRAALKIATQYNIYAYDAYFLECALNLRSPLLTLDRQMKAIAQKIGIQAME